jgi:hypothetical protein
MFLLIKLLKMKKTLEYKILKYLFEKNTEDLKFIELEFKEKRKDGFKVLEYSINELAKRELINVKPFPITSRNEKDKIITTLMYEKLDLCKINIDGIEFLHKIESLEINFKLSKSSIDTNKLNEKNSRFNKYATIINIILGIINVYILIHQGTKN